MKTAFIIILYKTPKMEVDRLKEEVRSLRLPNYRIYFIDNTKTGLGFAAGVNKGIRKALVEGTDLFVVANPDISLVEFNSRNFFDGFKHFDIYGFVMKQNDKTYYGGEIDRWRMSGGLIYKKPKKRFEKTDFVTGSFMVIKKKVINKVGFFDESYGMYYEDVDYCTRARKIGFKVGIDSEVEYKHFELSKNNINKEKYLKKNRVKFLLKYGTLSQKLYEFIRLPKTLLEESSFIFNFLSLNFSSILSKSLNFILFLFLIRFLSTNEYGIYTLVWAHIGLLAPIADLGTTSYGIIYLPVKKGNKINDLYSLRFFLSVIVLVLTLFLAVLLKYNSSILTLIFLISPVIFANMASGSLLIQYSLKEKLYKASIISSIFNVILIIFLIIVLKSFRSLTDVFITASIFYLFYFFTTLYFLKGEKVNLSLFFYKAAWKKIIKKSLVFVLIGFFAGLYFKADVFLLNFLKGQKEVGVYSAGYKFFEALMFLAASYNMTASPILARLVKRKENLQAKIKKDILFLLTIGLSVVLLSFVFAPKILPFLLNADYINSIEVFRIVVFALPLILISSVFLNLIYVLKRAYIAVLLFAFQFMVNIALNLLFIPKYSYIASSYITVFSEVVNVVVLSIILWIILKKYKHA